MVGPHVAVGVAGGVADPVAADHDRDSAGGRGAGAAGPRAQALGGEGVGGRRRPHVGGFGRYDRLWPYLRGDDVGHVCGEEGDRREGYMKGRIHETCLDTLAQQAEKHIL